MCMALPPLMNGQLSYATDTIAPYNFGTIATHICDTGFGIIGNVGRTCEKVGTSPVGAWSGTATTCGGSDHSAAYLNFCFYIPILLMLYYSICMHTLTQNFDCLYAASGKKTYYYTKLKYRKFKHLLLRTCMYLSFPYP